MKTITKEKWKKTPKDYKEKKENGETWLLYMGENGTTWSPVKIINEEAER